FGIDFSQINRLVCHREEPALQIITEFIQKPPGDLGGYFGERVGGWLNLRPGGSTVFKKHGLALATPLKLDLTGRIPCNYLHSILSARLQRRLILSKCKRVRLHGGLI